MHYTFEHKKSKKRTIVEMPMAKLDDYKKANPQLIQVLAGFAGFIPGVGAKPDDGFRDILREIKKAHPGGTVDTY